MKWYWLWWAIITFLAFFIPEMWALLTKNPQNTLSETVWNFESLKNSHWTFAHLAFTSIFGWTTFWLFFHFGWGLFR